jgi:hypothetical protein
MVTTNFTRLFSNSGLHSPRMKSTMLVFLFALIGCGGKIQKLATSPTPTPLTAAQVFSNTAETWNFKNSSGDTTTIEVIRVDENHSTWHYTKSAGRAYWAPPTPNAEIWFDLERDFLGDWYSTGGLVNEPGIPMQRYAVTTKAGQPRPYLILPSLADFSYTAIFDDVIPSGDGQVFVAPNTPWKTSSYMEFVTTPVFTGMAYVSDQFEGPCIHEKWYFAPKIGMVKILPVAQISDCAPGSSPYDATTVEVITTYRTL